jgi:putative hemolysin
MTRALKRFVVAALLLAAMVSGKIADARPSDCNSCLKDINDTCINPAWWRYDWCLGTARQAYINCKRAGGSEEVCDKVEQDRIIVCEANLENTLSMCEALLETCDSICRSP